MQGVHGKTKVFTRHNLRRNNTSDKCYQDPRISFTKRSEGRTFEDLENILSLEDQRRGGEASLTIISWRRIDDHLIRDRYASVNTAYFQEGIPQRPEWTVENPRGRMSKPRRSLDQRKL
jgi:hypothetical protein